MQQEDAQDEHGGGSHAQETAWPRPRYGLSEESQVTPSMPEAERPHPETEPEHGRASVARVVAIVISAGLAWATAVTLVAWILGRLLSH